MRTPTLPRGLVIRAAIGTGIALTVLAGCWNHSAPSRPVTILEQRTPQDSPEHCVLGLTTAYVQRDLPGYLALFSRDFTSVPSPVDVQDPNNPISPKPASFPFLADSAATDSLFHSELVDQIELTFQQQPAVESDAVYAGTWTIRLNSVDLRIHARVNGEPKVYQVPIVSGDLYFKKYPNERANNGLPLWRIWRWVYGPVSFGVTQPQGSTGRGIRRIALPASHANRARIERRRH